MPRSLKATKTIEERLDAIEERQALVEELLSLTWVKSQGHLTPSTSLTRRADAIRLLAEVRGGEIAGKLGLMKVLKELDRVAVERLYAQGVEPKDINSPQGH